MLKLLGDLLAAPVTGPVHGFEFILKTIQEQVEAEVLDESKVQGEMMQLGLRHEMGEIDDAEYAAQEDALMQRLNEIWRYKKELAEAEAGVDADAGGADLSGDPGDTAEGRG